MSKRNNRNRKSQNECRATASEFRIHPKAYDVANQMGDKSSIDYLRNIFNLASSAMNELRDCTHFEFLSEIHIDDIGHFNERGQLYSFWVQTNQLIILARKTSSRAVIGLVDGLCSALGSKNELVFGLMARALIEHSASLHALNKCVGPLQQHLVVVWGNGICDQPISDSDKHLRKELLRFVVGRRVRLEAQDVPLQGDSISKWKAYNDSLRSVPDDFESRQIMTAIDSLSKQENSRHLRTIYEYLCEYCHPNSASRTLDFNITIFDSGKHRVVADTEYGLSPGFRSVYSLCQAIIPSCCNAIESCLSVLSRCQMPINDKLEMLKLPPIGGKRVVDQFGRVGWVRPEQFRSVPGLFGRAKLSDHQLERIKRFQEVFREVQPMTLEERIERFEGEGPNLEQEMTIWEHLLDVYEAELKDRGIATLPLQKLLFIAFWQFFEQPSLGDALSVRPELKALSDLARVYARVKGK
jgi:hypothetical protein